MENVSLNQSQFDLLKQYIEDQGGVEGAKVAGKSITFDANVTTERLRQIFDSAGLTEVSLPAPGGEATQVNVTVLNDKLGAESKSLATDMQVIMELLHKMTQEQRQSSREMRDASIQSRLDKLQEVADKMRDAADARMAAAMVQGAFQIASGAISIAGAGMSLGAMKGVGASSSTNTITIATTKAQTYNAMAGGIGGVTTGVGTMISGGVTRIADGKEVEKTEAQTEAEKHQANVEKMKEFFQTLQEVMQDIRQKLAAMEQSNHDTARTILRA